jgi:hypothetical protein
MSKPKAYDPEYGYRYQILCRQGREWEHCDYAKDRNEKKYLIDEYRLAYGPSFDFCAIELPMKYWKGEEA